jgi:hypothetical protein
VNALMGRRLRWRVWQTERLLRVGVKVIAVTVLSLLAGEIPLPRDGSRRRVTVVNKLSARPLPVAGGRIGRFDRWLHNQEVAGYLTVDPDRDIFLWEAEDRDGSVGPIARVFEPFTTVRVTDRWTYRFGRRTVVVVSLGSGADLWLTGRASDVALRQLR